MSSISSFPRRLRYRRAFASIVHNNGNKTRVVVSVGSEIEQGVRSFGVMDPELAMLPVVFHLNRRHSTPADGSGETGTLGLKII